MVRAASPAHGPHDPRYPAWLGGCGKEGDCAGELGELGELVQAVSGPGPRASGGAAFFWQARPTTSEFLLGRIEQRNRDRWDPRPPDPRPLTPDSGSRGQ